MTAKIQYSMKEPSGGIMVVGGDTTDEFMTNFAELFSTEAMGAVLDNFAGRIVSMDTAITNLQSGGMLPAGQPVTNQAQSPLRPEATTPTPPQCSHGDRSFVSKPAQNGKKAWAAWMCGAPQELKVGRCSPIWE